MIRTDRGTKVSRRRKGAFTLIELLVVVGIILILIAITIGSINVVARKAATAQTMKVLQQVKTGLGMFYGSYGAYPPTDQFGGTDNTEFNRLANENLRSLYPTVQDWHERTGLVYYLNYISPDSARWVSYLDGLPNSSGMNTSNVVDYTGGQLVCSNRMEWYVDGWGRTLYYQCTIVDDHQGYKLWSSGENQVNENGGGDDIGVSSRD